MSAGIFVLDVIATLVLSAALLFSYGNWMRQHLVTSDNFWGKFWR
jgi:hypothetical protein